MAARSSAANSIEEPLLRKGELYCEENSSIVEYNIRYTVEEHGSYGRHTT